MTRQLISTVSIRDALPAESSSGVAIRTTTRPWSPNRSGTLKVNPIEPAGSNQIKHRVPSPLFFEVPHGSE